MFAQVPTVQLRAKNHAELLASDQVDVVYVAVPHNLHEKLYCDVLAAGKDLLAEKPFGIDLAAAFAMPRKLPDSLYAAARNFHSPPARSTPSTTCNPAHSDACSKFIRDSSTAATSTPPSPPIGNATRIRAEKSA